MALQDISSYYNKMYVGDVWPVPVQIKRGNGLPLDQSTIFQTYAAALDYAAGNEITSTSPDGTVLKQTAAYRGQYIAVVPIQGETSAFIVNNEGGLTPLATGGAAADLLKKLNKEIKDRGDADTYLSNEISTLVETTLPLSVGNLQSSLSATVEKLDTPETGFEATYVVKQGGVQVGASINIPKDKVISSAYMVNVVGNYETGHAKPEYDNISSFTVTYADESKTPERDDPSTSAVYWSIWNAYTGPEGGDGSYLRITVTNAEATPIYIAVPELVDTYVGGTTTEISVGVEGKKGETRVIYADLNAGSIAESKLCADFAKKVNDVIAAEAEDRAKIVILSGDENTDGSVAKTLKDAKAYTNQEVLALSTSLSNTVDAELTALEKTLSTYTENQVLALSIALSNDISSLSSSLNGEIAAEVTAREKAIEALSTSLSNTIDAKDTALERTLSTYTENQVLALSTSLSNTIDNELTALEKKLSGYTDSEVLKLSTSLSNTIDNELTALEKKLSGYTDSEILKLSTSLSNEISSTKDELGDLIAGEIDRATDAEEELGKQISALSTSLSNTVDAELTALEYKLSTYTQTYTNGEILKLSTSLSTNLSNEIDRATKAENKITSDFAALSNDIGLSAASNTNMVVTKKDIADLAGAMHFRGITTTDLSTGLSVIPEGTGYYDPSATPPKVPTAGDMVIHATNSKEFVWAGEKWASTGTTGKWYELGDEGIYLKKAEFELWRDTTLENRLTAIEDDVDVISSAAENKVKIGTGHYDGTTWTDDLTNKTSLSVVKIADEDYYKLVSAGKQNDDVLYIVSSDYVNGHDQRIINVGNAISATDAVNLSTLQLSVNNIEKQYTDDKILSVKINTDVFELTSANHIAALSIEIISCGNAN